MEICENEWIFASGGGQGWGFGSILQILWSLAGLENCGETGRVEHNSSQLSPVVQVRPSDSAVPLG